MENFPSIMDDFLAAKALRQVADFQTLEKTIEEMLSNPSVRAQLGEAAHDVIESRRGVITKMVEEVGRVL
jgi:3-deoxy-D-manno-octulosonic-acid transferase